MRILIIDDEIKLTDALSFMLKKEGYSVDTANDGINGYDLASSGIYDVIILDIMLPYKDGLTILRDLRKINITTPIIMLTAKSSIEDRVLGLEKGADDYLIKPFATEELIARIKVVSRRKSTEILSDEVKVSNLSLSFKECLLRYGNKTMKLKLKEAQILELLMQNANHVVTRDMLLDKIWGFESIEVNNIEAHICYLRKKIDFKSSNLKLETIRGIGYILKEI